MNEIVAPPSKNGTVQDLLTHQNGLYQYPKVFFPKYIQYYKDSSGKHLGIISHNNMLTSQKNAEAARLKKTRSAHWGAAGGP
jgi:hypothetical protein